MKYVIIAIIFCSCADFTDERHFEVDARLKPFVDEFYRQGKLNGLNIQRDNLIATIEKCDNPEAYGESIDDAFIPTIHIDPDFFQSVIAFNDSLSNYHIQYVVFHELGHALLKRHHTEKRSIMQKYIVWGSAEYASYDTTRLTLNKELFRN